MNAPLHFAAIANTVNPPLSPPAAGELIHFKHNNDRGAK